MPLTMRSRKSTKSQPKFKAPARQSCSSCNVLHDGRNLERRIPKIKMSLMDNVTSALSKEGNWYTEFEGKEGSKDLLSLQRTHDKLVKDKEMLTNKNKILLDLAKEKVGQLEKLEKERRQLLRIVKKTPRDGDKMIEEEENDK